MSALAPFADLTQPPCDVPQVPLAAVSRCRNAQPNLLDHLVGVLQERLRDREAECFRGLEIDDELELA
jgi:hypothetical protein